MSTIMNFISENYQWIFSGFGVAFITFLFSKKGRSISFNIGNFNFNPSFNKNRNESIKTPLEPQRLTDKERVKILFIDDKHKDFQIVSILKKAKWQNVKSIKDIFNLDNNDVRNSDIIFVDINGVGTTLFEDQGLGMAVALKKKFPEKTIIIYSAETNGDRFHPAFKVTDDCLRKNAEPYEFIRLIEEYAKKY